MPTRKTKKPQTKDKGKSDKRDQCQTPYYALDLILPWLPQFDGLTIWEPATGQGMMVDRLVFKGHQVLGTDLLTGSNYFDFQPHDYGVQVTNPPYSVKYEWLERAYHLGKPFALLMPIDVMGAATAQRLFSEYGVQIILMDKRIDFYMPNKGFKKGGSPFASAWYTWKFNLPDQINYATITQYPNEQISLFDTMIPGGIAVELPQMEMSFE